ncbi:MAG TPA: zf-HC2 domain-containing protein [Trebonia sp.]|nr:zf-HC2 domain-containing protein [Trebonia sp.]
MRFPFGAGRGRGPGPADIVCRQAVEMVTDYIEDALPGDDRQRYERHLADCPHCTEYLAQVRETIRLAGRLTPSDMSPEMRDAFADVFRRWRAED